ncbi:substrate-binding domain-containing protein, partial [Azospirillum sp. B506]|uniref:substrate-binding domain-containing protein n=1 Tax=Azospirillum sp. B506 TaxID=137721 RepID=UPI000679913F
MAAWPLGYLKANARPFTVVRRDSPVTGTVLRLHGSNTIGAELAPVLLRRWVESNGNLLAPWISHAPLESAAPVQGGNPTLPARVEVFAHGSSTGIPDLVGDRADLAMLSRAPNDRELDMMRRAGAADPRGRSSETVVGLDGLAVFVNSANHVPALTPEQIGGIFTGRITDWRQVGGRPGPIQVFHRPDGSGTLETFRTLLLDGAQSPLAGTEIESSEVLSDQVSGTPGAVGFTGLAYVHNNEAVSVDECGIEYPPHPFLVKSEEYPLFRRLYMHRLPDSRNPWVEPFVRFLGSATAEDAVERAGFVNQAIELGDESITAMRRAALTNPKANSQTRGRAEESAIERMRALTDRYTRLSTTFRFDHDKDVIDAAAEDNLDRLRVFMGRPENLGRKLVVIGFASASGGDAHNLNLSRRRAHNIANRITGFGGITVAEEIGIGRNLYVACNDTESRAR